MSASAASSLTGVEKSPGASERHLSECPVCFEVYVDPQLLPCDHSLCVGCVDRIKEAGWIKCPMCQVVHDVISIRSDFRLTQFLDALRERKTSLTVEETAEPAEVANVSKYSAASVYGE